MQQRKLPASIREETFQDVVRISKRIPNKVLHKIFCKKSKECNLGKYPYCLKELKTIDLKQLYDTCEEEVSYKGFRADLMLSNKEHPEREPMFIEIYVTHGCGTEKIKSGIKIIEIRIEKEDDLSHALVEENSPFFRFSNGDPYPFTILLPVRFYNFKRKFERVQDDNCIEPQNNCPIDSVNIPFNSVDKTYVL